MQLFYALDMFDFVYDNVISCRLCYFFCSIFRLMFYILSANTLEKSTILPIVLTESLRTKHAKICRKSGIKKRRSY